MGLRALNKQQEVSMNWKEKLRKECEHLNEVSGFYSFSVMIRNISDDLVVRNWPPNIKKHTRDISISKGIY